MTDPHEHDELLRNRIRDAVRHLNGASTGLQSDEDIAAQLDAVSAAPLADDEVQRIMNTVNRDLGLAAARTGVQGQQRMNSAAQEDDAMQKRRSGSSYVRPTAQSERSRGSSSVAVIVAASACLLAAVGLLQVAQDEGPKSAEVVPASIQDLVVETAESQPRLMAELIQESAPLAAVQIGETLSTGERERRRVSLPDGSVLFINEQTTVTVASDRRLNLARGDVFVEVVPAELADGDRFVVETPDRAVTAHGTKFAVTAAGKETSVLVTQGTVEVTGVGPLLTAGQEIVLDDRVQPTNPDVGIVAAPRASEALGWTRELMAAAVPVMVPKSEHAGGSVVVVDPDGQEMRLSLRRFHVDVQIQDGFARTTIDQTYFNHTFSRQEGTFHFPLPPDASLSRLAMYVNGKLMEGGMAERQRARDVYEQIRHTRRDPALLEWVDGSTFKMRVFPLEARQEKRIVLSYTQRLPNDYDRSVYRFPAGHSLERVGDWTTRVRVDGGADKTTKQNWFSPSHLLKATEEDGDLVLEGELANAALDKDLVVELKPANKDKAARRGSRRALRFSSMQHEGFQYLMLRYRPDLAGELQRPKRNWVFLFESSGDRNPLLARVQIEVIRTLLDNAEHDDTFSIVTAATRSEAFRSEPAKCSAKNIKQALAHLAESHLVGALDLGKAFSACDDFCDANGESWLVHVGSATPTVGERDAKKLLKRLPADAKYVGIGVGKRWDRSFMKSAAARSGGHFTQINPDEKVAWRAFELFSTLNAPRLLQIDVKSERKNPRWLCFAETIAHGQEIAAVTRVPMTAKLPQSVMVTGVLDDEEFEQTVEVEDVAGKAGYLPRIWARQEIDRLVAAGAEKHKAEIIVLSKAMYVMSPFTSLLVLEDEAMYKQFAIDRGRKDHWALYPAPEQIEVVHEPNATVVNLDDPQQLLERRLKTVRAERDVARANYQLAIRDSQPAGQVKFAQSMLEDREVAVKELEAQVARVEALSEDFVAKIVTTVLGRAGSADSIRGVAPHVWYGNTSHQWDESGQAFMGLPIVDGFNSHQLMYGQPETSYFLKVFDQSNSMNTAWGLAAAERGLGRRFPMEDVNGNSLIDGLEVSTDFEDRRTRRLISGLPDGSTGLWESELLQRRRLTDLNRLSASTEFEVEERISRYELAYRLQDTRGRGGVPLGLSVVPVAELRELGIAKLARFYRNDADFRLGEVDFLSSVDLVASSSQMLLDLEPEFIRPTLPIPSLSFSVPSWRSMELVRAHGNEFDPRFADVNGDGLLPTPGGLNLVLTQEQQVGTRFLTQLYDVSDLVLPADQWMDSQDGWYYRSNGSGSSDNIVQFKTNVTSPSVHYIRRLDGVHIPVMVAPQGVLRDPVSYAPGMESSSADLLAVLEREAPEAVAVESGKVDRGARRLIERSRKRGWEEVSISTGGEGGKITVTVNGAGQFVYERELHEGLNEQVVCDGESLWHLYSDLGIGARRDVSRFHRRTLQRMIPWFVAPAADLAHGADVKLVDRRTIRIVPIAAEGENAEEPKGQKRRRRLALELIFDDEARLIERRVVDLNDNDMLLHRVSFQADGTVTVFVGASRQSRTVKLNRHDAKAPTLKPDVDGLVVLPLPYRSAESYAVALPGKPADEEEEKKSEYSEISEADAMKLIATYFANRNAVSMWQVIRGRFFLNGDARIGFATLLASASAQDTAPIHELASQPVVTDGKDSGTAGTPATLGNFLVQWCDWRRNRDLSREFIVPERTAPFLQKLAQAHNLNARWATGRATKDRTAAQVRTEFRRAMAFVRELKTPGLAWQLLSVIEGRLRADEVTDSAYYEPLAEEAARFEKFAGLAGKARLTRIQWLLTAGQKDKAEELYSEFLEQSAEVGVAPQLHSSLHDAFAEQSGDNAAWRKLVKQTGRKLAGKERPIELIALAMQCVRNAEHDLGQSLYETATEDVDLAAQPAVAFFGLKYAWEAEEWAEAEKCLQALLQDDKRVRVGSLWRRASEVAAALGDEDESLRRLEQALDVEFAELPDLIDIAKFREAYSPLLARMEEYAQQQAIAQEALPEDFVARVIRVVDRWRSVDPDATASCQAAARILDIVGEHGLAWDYWTTPLATTPNESSAWTALARALRDRSRIVEADKAFGEAFACEQTNPEILIERADMLLLDGQRRNAMKLYGQITEGKWQPRFSGVQSRAAAALQAGSGDDR